MLRPAARLHVGDRIKIDGVVNEIVEISFSTDIVITVADATVGPPSWKRTFALPHNYEVEVQSTNHDLS